MSGVTRLLGHWHPKWTITKFHDSDGAVAKWKAQGHTAFEASVTFQDRLVEIKKFEYNGVTQTGANLLWNLFTDIGGASPFSNANTRLGVSTDSTGFFNTQTNLNPSGLAAFYMQLMDATFPLPPTTQVVFEATFDMNTANFHWQSFGVDNDAIDGAGDVITSYSPGTIGLVNREVVDQGTKVLGDTWILSLILEVT